MNLTLLAYKIAAAILPSVPPVLVEWLAEIAGWLGWLGSGPARKAVRSNLRVVQGREPTGGEVRRVFITAAQNYCDLFSMPRLSVTDLRDRVEVDGWHYLERALAGGRGALLASLHLGNLEVVAYAATSRGLKVMLPVEKIEPPELLDLMIQARERAGFVCKPVSAGALEGIREALRANSIVGIGADRVTLGPGLVLRFCGHPARLPVAAALLALRTGVPLLPMGSYRRPGRRYLVCIGPPIAADAVGPLRASVVTLTERLLVALETFLRLDPTQWVVFRPVWDTPPARGFVP